MAINYLKVRNGVTFKPTSQPTTAEDGDVYYDSTANLFYFYQNGAWINFNTTANYRAGSTSISSGVTSISITFSSTLSSTNYAVVATMMNTTDSNPQFIPITITSISATGFTATWNLATDTANYKLNWNATLNN